jgi:hypothetical protein
VVAPKTLNPGFAAVNSRGKDVGRGTLRHPASDRDAEQNAVDRDEATNERAMHHRIAVAAYFLAEHRNFAPGHEMEDWLSAERELHNYAEATNSA